MVYFKYNPGIGMEGIRIPNALTKFQTAYCRLKVRCVATVFI